MPAARVEGFAQAFADYDCEKHDREKRGAREKDEPPCAAELLRLGGQKIRRNIAAMRSMPAGTRSGELVFMHEAVFYYGCRCSDEQIRQMIDHLPEDHQKELWQDSESLEVECPRCGLKHTIYR